MRFLLDMNLPLGVAEWMRINGHDAVHARDLGHAFSTDREIFAYAAADQRIVITFDLDFGEIAAQARDARIGVVLLRLRLARRTYLMERLRIALAEAGDALQAGAFVIVEDARIRIRKPQHE